MSFDIIKAGWLHRESSVLRRWKRNWFVLYQDGILRYFESPESHEAEEAVRIQTDCVQVRVGHQVTNTTPPPGYGRDCLLEIKLRDKTWTLCAESADDLSAWQMSLEDSRVIPAGHPPPPGPRSRSAPPPGYSTTVYPQQQVAYAYPGQVVYGSQPPPQVVVPPGQTTVIYTDDPYYRRRYRYDGSDVALGVMAGAMLMPYWWW